MVPNGETPEEVKNHPALQGLDIPKTGKNIRGGVLVTKSLLFVGAARRGEGEPILQAFDKRTGERIAALDLPSLAYGAPMTYMRNGKQYIVVAVSGPGHPGELVALNLPSPSSQSGRPAQAGE
jgi:quinoprotein glucose dehydrogenase